MESALLPEISGRYARPAPMVPERFRVTDRRQETADTWTLDAGAARPRGRASAFLPGPVHMLYAFGAGEVPISISGDPRRPDRLVHTVRAVGAATRGDLPHGAGRVLGVRGPFGSDWPVGERRGTATS